MQLTNLKRDQPFCQVIPMSRRRHFVCGLRSRCLRLAISFLVTQFCFSFCNTLTAGDFSLSAPISFKGAVDGSAVAEVGNGFFVVTSDEENVLRLYVIEGGPPSKQLDIDIEGAVKRALSMAKIKECDIEGAAKLGDLIFWIGSHGRNKDAKEKRERQVFFATKVIGTGKGTRLELEGEVYIKLLNDLVTHPALATFDLGKAASLAPKEKGALNIESLAADDGKLWIGFRNPSVKDKQALVVPLLNPKETVMKGGSAKLGDPIFLTLGGLGIRDMAKWNEGFLIIAGDFKDRFDGDAKPSRLFFWKPGADPKDLGVDFGDLNPEGIAVMHLGSDKRVLILSDDGKYPKQPGNAFRGVWLQSPPS
jgi:hypothetical protein